MRKILSIHAAKIFFFILLFLVMATSSLLLTLPDQKTPEIKSKAAGNTLTVCQSGCQFAGATGLQQAVDAALDGDIINISGTISGSGQMSPFSGRMNVKSCFVDLRGKSLTLKGGTLFGEGHDKGAHEEGDPLYHRAGICSRGGNITLDGVHVKEFEGGGMQFINAQVILKNSLIDGHDHGGVFLINSAILAVNNNFVSTIGLLPLGNSPIKAYNNTFYGSKAINAECNQNIPSIDFVNNIVVDAELTIGAGWIYGDCPTTIAQFKSQHIVYNAIWKGNYPCYDNHEYCDNYPGKITLDPLVPEEGSGIDQRGLQWGSLDPRPGSPVIGAGDPSIPGPKNIGSTGGPCVDGNSPVCLSFIEQQKSQLQAVEPIETIPTLPPYQPPDSTQPQQPIPPDQSTQPPSDDSGPPITYYLPPTMSFSDSNQPPRPKDDQPLAEAITPTITPTPKPLIDVAKTVESAKNTWNNLITSLIKFTKTILP